MECSITQQPTARNAMFHKKYAYATIFKWDLWFTHIEDKRPIYAWANLVITGSSNVLSSLWCWGISRAVKGVLTKQHVSYCWESKDSIWKKKLAWSLISSLYRTMHYILFIFLLSKVIFNNYVLTTKPTKHRTVWSTRCSKSLYEAIIKDESALCDSFYINFCVP